MRVASCVQGSSAFAIHAPLCFEPPASAMPPGKGAQESRESGAAGPPQELRFLTVTRLEPLGSWSFWRQVISDAGLGHLAVTTHHHEIASRLASSSLCSRVRWKE